MGTAVSLASCSRANYAFNNTAPAYLGAEQVHSSVGVAPSTIETATAALAPEVEVVASTSAHQTATALAQAKSAKHVAVVPLAQPSAPIAQPMQLVAPATADVKLVAPTTAPVKKAKKPWYLLSPKEAKAEGKSQLVALILSFFLGGLGIHRFYLGYVGIGILELLTFGVFGILSLIDFIRIIIGTLKPKNGEYAKKL